MKKFITPKTIIALTITLFTFNSFAQSFYLKLNAGYNWGIASNVIGYNLNTTGTVTSYDKVNLSFGKGINLCGTVGYMFNKNVGAELGVNYLIGGNTETTVKSNSFYSTVTYSSTLFNFIPSLIYTTDFDKINPYAKVGFSVGMASMTTKRENVDIFGSVTNTESQTSVASGGIAVGLISAIGVSYKMTEKLSLFGELNISTLSYSPTKSEVTESKLNGVNNLITLSNRDKYTEYSDSYSEDSSTPTNNDVARKSTPINIPFSSLGLHIGLKYNF